MFRIRISYYRDGDNVIARLKSNNFTKSAKGHFIQSHYQLALKCKELIRDELYRKHGANWRDFYQEKQMINSSYSAIRRAKQY